MPNNNHQFSEEARGKKNKTHEVLEKGDDVGVDEVHSSFSHFPIGVCLV